MNKVLKQESSASKLCTIELFGANGSKTISGNQPILFTKLVTTEGKNTWILLHQN
ncbi:MAG: hypothetical protein ACI9GO_000713 [Bacteroidia bacterium]|jgi:hypothetical protein